MVSTTTVRRRYGVEKSANAMAGRCRKCMSSTAVKLRSGVTSARTPSMKKTWTGPAELRLTLATLGEEALERAEPQVQGTSCGVGPLRGQGVVHPVTGPHQWWEGHT